MKKWNQLTRISWSIFLCFFVIEYLHPSAVGVRATAAASEESPAQLFSEPYTDSLPTGKSLPSASSYYGYSFSKKQALSATRISNNSVVTHAMISFSFCSDNKTFPPLNFISTKHILINQQALQEIYHPPRLFNSSRAF